MPAREARGGQGWLRGALHNTGVGIPPIPHQQRQRLWPHAKNCPLLKKNRGDDGLGRSPSQFGVFALELISQEGEYPFNVLRQALGQAIIHVEEEQ